MNPEPSTSWSTMSVVAVTVAPHGRPSISAISPKDSPAPISATNNPARVTAAVPSTMIHHRSATLPSVQITSPSFTVRTSRRDEDSPESSSGEHPSNNARSARLFGSGISETPSWRR